MVKTTQNIKTTLKTWLWNKPARFTGWALIFGVLFFGASYIPNIEKIPAVDIAICIITIVAFVFMVRDLIKNLPYKNINHSNFVAITNAYKLLSVLVFSGWMGLTFLMNKCKPSDIHPYSVSTDINQAYFVIPRTLFSIIEIIWFVVAAYLLGLWISNIYVKYKRAKDTGLSGWKVILSMPFTFMMSWMPGYLSADKKNQSGLTIKSRCYDIFNKWVVSNSNNTLFVFLLLFIFANLFVSTHLSTIFFPLILFAIYMLWKTVTKESFTKHINRGYIWTAIIINILMLISFIRMTVIYLQMFLHQ